MTISWILRRQKFTKVTEFQSFTVKRTPTSETNSDCVNLKMSTEDLCAECYMPVRPRQEGLQCDDCFTWQHRTCETGISQRKYRETVRLGQDIDWCCKYCTYTSDGAISGNELSLNLTMPIAMSTRIDEASVADKGNRDISENIKILKQTALQNSSDVIYYQVRKY